MILIGAFGLFWFGRCHGHPSCSLSASVVPCHSACLPRSAPAGGTVYRSGAKPAEPLQYRGVPIGGRGRECQSVTTLIRHHSLTLYLAFLVAWRAVRQRWSFEGELGMGGGGGVPNTPRGQPGFTGNTRGRGGYRARSWPCSPYDADCVVEEWSYY